VSIADHCLRCCNIYNADRRFGKEYCSDECAEAHPYDQALDSIATAARKHAEASHDRAASKNDLRQAILRAREEGMTLAEIGRRIGVSRQRVHQLSSGKP